MIDETEQKLLVDPPNAAGFTSNLNVCYFTVFQYVGISTLSRKGRAGFHSGLRAIPIDVRALFP